ARAAVAVVAAFLGTRELQLIAQDFEEAVARLAEEIGFLAVDGAGDVEFLAHSGFSPSAFSARVARHASAKRGNGYHQNFARSIAMARVRFTSTPTRCRR